MIEAHEVKMDRIRIYDIIYALVARDGREAALFGDSAPAAREAFSRSLVGNSFPELWFESPLAGDPWLDLHALVSYGDVAEGDAVFSGQGGVYADALAWFASQPRGAVRQLALSYDSHAGDVDNPAVQLLVGGSDVSVPLGFLEAVGRSDAKQAYRAFVESMPESWYACYVGTFPGRHAADGQRWLRVECIVGDIMQQAYADDVAVLRDHLSCVGVTWLDDDELREMQELARSPFPLELQFNVDARGKAQPVVSASVRFNSNDWMDLQRRMLVGRLISKVQDWGMADERWEQFSGTVFAKRLTQGDEACLISCIPAFLKIRWREGEPPCAKAYLVATAN